MNSSTCPPYVPKTLALLLTLLLLLTNGCSIGRAPQDAFAGKPPGPATASLTPQTERVAMGEATLAHLEIVPKVTVATLHIALQISGNALLQGETTFDFSNPAVDEAIVVPVAHTVSGDGNGTIQATIEVRDGTGATVATVKDLLHFLGSEGSVFYSTSGTLDLEVKRLEYAHTKGALNDADYKAALAAALGGGAVAETTFVTDTIQTAATDLNISGYINWQDSWGGYHPVRQATVEIRDEELIDSELVTTVTTDEFGYYNAIVNNDDGIGESGRDIFVRVLAIGPGFSIKPPGAAAVVHRIDSTVSPDVADGSVLFIDLYANNTDDNNTAFSVHDAMVTANDYVPRVNALRFPDIEIIFPTTQFTSLYNGTNLHILQLDRFDWDVIHHEFGHYVMDQLNIEDNPGGAHSLSSNMGETRGKDAGTRLAWGEGWPTYFGTVLQQVMGADLFWIPNVGDIRYQDTEDTTIDYSLESMEGGPSTGEDSEASVQRALWDLYDSANDAGDSGVGYGDITIWSALDGADPVRLSAAYQALTAGKPLKEVTKIGCVFAEHAVAPKLTAPADLSEPTEAPPTFEWVANGGGPSNRNNKFVVEFYNADFSSLLFASPEQDATTYTPTQEDWDNLLAQAGGMINWVVKGRQTNAPATGPYLSCARRLIALTVDLVFVIDTTGSMWDDIASVQESATSIVNTFAESGVDWRMGLVTFKDHPIEPYGDPTDYPARIELGFSTDKDAILAAINSLGADGGNDWPESVYSGLMQAIAFSWRAEAAKSIILMGDAPPHDPEPVTGHTFGSVTAAANAVEVVLESLKANSFFAAAATGSVAIYPIIIGSDFDTDASFKSLAEATGGKAFDAQSASDVVGAILDAIEAILLSPVAKAGGPYQAVPGLPLTVDGSGSLDPDGTLELYEWDFNNDGTYDVSRTTATAVYTYPSEYSGNLVLRVTDNDGNTATDTALVSPIVNLPPTANAGGPYTGQEGTAFVLNGAGSSDPEGGALAYEWNFGDGTTGTGVTVTHTYADNGVYTATLTVSDPAGNQHSQTATVSIANLNPTIHAIVAPAQAVNLKQQPITVEVQFSDPGFNFPLAGTSEPLTVNIEWGDGTESEQVIEKLRAATFRGQTAQEVGIFANIKSLAASHTYAGAGVYQLNVTVTDDDGGSTSELFDSVVIHHPQIQATPNKLLFQAVANASNPTAQPLKISNSGTGNLSWGAAESIPWLSLSSLSGSAPSTVTVNVDIAGLTTGSYSGTVALTGTDADPVNLLVELVVSDPSSAPSLSIAPATLAFTTEVGTDPAAQSLNIQNSGFGALAWTLSKSESWLEVSATAGNAPATVQVSVKSAGLAGGLYQAQIVVTAPGATNSQQTIAVSLLVAETSVTSEGTLYMPNLHR